MTDIWPHSAVSPLKRFARRLIANKFLGALKTPWLSIFITGNRGVRYLRLALASLRCQSLPRATWEVIVCNLNSKDEILETIQGFASSRFNVRSFHGGGDTVDEQQAIYNEAITAARGQVAVLMTDDQIVKPDFLMRHAIRQAIERCLAIGDVTGHLHTHIFCPLRPPLAGTCPPMIVLQEKDITEQEKLANLIETFATDYRKTSSVRLAGALDNASIPIDILRDIGFDNTFLTPQYISRDFVYRTARQRVPIIFDSSARSLRQKTAWSYGFETRLQTDRLHFTSRHGMSGLNAVFQNEIQRIPIHYR